MIFEQHTQRYYLLDNKASVCWNELQYNNSLTYDSAQVLQLLIDDGIILMNCSSIDLECNESHINKYINIPQDFCDEIKSNGYILMHTGILPINVMLSVSIVIISMHMMEQEILSMTS